LNIPPRPAWRRAWDGVRRRLDRWPPGGVVLLYHRVAELDADPQRLAVTAAAFEAHLDILRRGAAPLPLAELVRRAHDGSLPARAVAITFDDGYADNLAVAAPLLDRYGVPATVFIASGAVGDGREFWWDALERLLLAPGTLPARVRVTIAGEVIEQDMGTDASYSDADRAACAGWHVEAGDTPTPRHQLYRELCRRLRRVPGDVCAAAIAGLASQASAAPPSRRALTPDEVTALGARDGIQIGSHTHSHPSLAYLRHDDQRREIAEGRRHVESWRGSPATAFAYPFGGRSDVSDEVAAVARNAGLEFACTTEPGRVHAGTDRFRVPRVLVRNWTGDEFGEHWRRWTS
jgi:peptidoglycan/xylan/chitin deacetylase (PgdA/CDA1 family)